jgi:hypothetical protein
MPKTTSNVIYNLQYNAFTTTNLHKVGPKDPISLVVFK